MMEVSISTLQQSNPIDYDSHIARLCDELIQSGHGFALKQIHDGEDEDLLYIELSEQEYREALLKRPDKANTLYALMRATKIIEEWTPMYNHIQDFFKAQGIDEVWMDDKRLI